MAARKFAGANLRLQEAINVALAALEGAQRGVVQQECVALGALTVILKRNDRAPPSPPTLIPACVATFLQLSFAASQTFRLIADLVAGWIADKPRHRLLPSDLDLLRALQTALGRFRGLYECFFTVVPLNVVGKLLAETIAFLRQQCHALRDSPLFAATGIRAIFQAITPLTHSDLEDFLLGEFYGVLQQCDEKLLPSLFAEALSASPTVFMTCTVGPWSKAHREADRAAALRCPLPEDDLGKLMATLDTSFGSHGKEEPSPSAIPPSPTDPVAKTLATLAHLRQFTLWPIWMLGCMMKLSTARVVGFVSRLLAAKHADRLRVSRDELSAIIADPTFRFAEKTALLSEFVDEFCGLPDLFLPAQASLRNRSRTVL